MTKKHKAKKLNFIKLTWPIFVEMLLWTMFNNIDTIMLSRYSDDAVAAVGNVGQLIFLVTIVLQIISMGSSIVISQKLGAKKDEEAAEVVRLSLYVNIILGVILSFLVFIFAGSLVKALGLKGNILEIGTSFYRIIGSFAFILATGSINTAILRSYGYTKYPMIINITTNLINIIGNSLFIFGFLGFPILGATGVAISTVFSQTLGVIASLIIVKRKTGVHILGGLRLDLAWENLKEITVIGVPSAAETMLYNFAQLVIIKIISVYGDATLTARAYVFTLIRFVMIISSASGSSAQIITGRLVGADKSLFAKKIVLKIFYKTFILVLFVSSMLAIFRVPLLKIFTDNPEIISIGSKTLLTVVLLETGRSFNLIFINSMKGAGYVKFPVIAGIISMWTIGVGLTYVLAIEFELGLLGSFLAVAADEWLRGLVMFFRWKSGAWRKFYKAKKKKLAMAMGN
ncbi:MAG: MATE family efflux transporter [Fusobacteriota bacterium]